MIETDRAQCTQQISAPSRSVHPADQCTQQISAPSRSVHGPDQRGACGAKEANHRKIEETLQEAEVASNLWCPAAECHSYQGREHHPTTRLNPAPRAVPLAGGREIESKSDRCDRGRDEGHNGNQTVRSTDRRGWRTRFVHRIPADDEPS